MRLPDSRKSYCQPVITPEEWLQYNDRVPTGATRSGGFLAAGVEVVGMGRDKTTVGIEIVQMGCECHVSAPRLENVSP